MTDDMMALRGLLEKSSDADLLREMIGLHRPALDGPGSRRPDRRQPRRTLRWSASTSATAIAAGLGRPAPGPSS